MVKSCSDAKRADGATKIQLNRATRAHPGYCEGRVHLYGSKAFLRHVGVI